MRGVGSQGVNYTHTEVGDEGIDAGDREPRRCVRRCCEVRLVTFWSLGSGGRLAFEVTWRRSALAVVVVMGVPERAVISPADQNS